MAFMNVTGNVAPTMSGTRLSRAVLACLEHQGRRARDTTYF